MMKEGWFDVQRVEVEPVGDAGPALGDAAVALVRLVGGVAGGQGGSLGETEDGARDEEDLGGGDHGCGACEKKGGGENR